MKGLAAGSRKPIQAAATPIASARVTVARGVRAEVRAGLESVREVLAGLTA